MITPALTLVCLGIRGCCQIHGEMSVAIRSSQQVMDKSCKPFVFKKLIPKKRTGVVMQVFSKIHIGIKFLYVICSLLDTLVCLGRAR